MPPSVAIPIVRMALIEIYNSFGVRYHGEMLTRSRMSAND